MYERFGRDELVQEPEIPEDGEHIWAWFWTLNSRREHGMNGPQPLAYDGIAAWARMTGEPIMREELHIITDMDDAYLTALANEREAQRIANEKPGK